MSILPESMPLPDPNVMAFVELTRTAPMRTEHCPGSQSLAIEDSHGGIIAKQSIIKYTTNQAYCAVSEYVPKIANKDVILKDADEGKLKLVSIQNERENRRLWPAFAQLYHRPEARPVEAHLTDRLAENMLGRFNLELKKNVTVDSFTFSDSWRDEAGFIVSDRNQYSLSTYHAKTLMNTLNYDKNVQISAFVEEDLDAVSDFDHGVCGFARDGALQYITSNATCFVVKGTGSIDGFIAGNSEHVLCLYAETLEIAHSLMKHYIETMKLNQVKFFTRSEVWECPAASSRPVYRTHTRAVPSSIKWAKVFALNMGFHIV